MATTMTMPPRAATGIEGVDHASHGGLPAGRATLVTGDPGAGKTVFGMQFLAAGARQHGEPGLCVAFEETPETLKRNVGGFIWSSDLGNLTVIDGGEVIESLPDGGFEIAGLLAQIDAAVAETGARRLVIDAVDALVGMLADAGSIRRELYRLYRWLDERDITTIITAKEDAGDGNSRLWLLDYLSDCVLSLSHDLSEGISTRNMVFRKYRGGGCRFDRLPLIINEQGIVAAKLARERIENPVSTRRVSTGVAALDDMLEGGFYAGTVTVVSGSSGTAKTTLAGAFASAACQRGERTLYLSFDEGGEQIVRNLRSVAIDLQPHVDSGVLELIGVRAGSKSAEQHFVEISSHIDTFRPDAVVLDSVGALEKAGGHDMAVPLAQRLMDQIKAMQATAVITTLVDSEDPSTESTPLHISTIADTWIHLSYVPLGGERNRALTVIKSRGTSHSNQVRELLLSREGVALADVYAAGGEVLMGTARVEKEQDERRLEQQRRRDFEARKTEIASEQLRLQRELESIRQQLEQYQRMLETLEGGEDSRRHEREDASEYVRQRRESDHEHDKRKR